MNNIRIDDIGASAKYYNRHIKFRINFGGMTVPLHRIFNIGPVKTCRFLKGWAVYDEMKPEEWDEIFKVFDEFSQIPIIAVTACWVDAKSNLIPFPEKFIEEAGYLKSKLKQRKIIIANHGLTHCVLGKQKSGFWGSNQFYWREFYPFLDETIHTEHILKSQEILEGFFEESVTIFVPPGNIWCQSTYKALLKTNIKLVLAGRYMCDTREVMEGMKFINDKSGLLNIHDRELKLFGPDWLREKLKSAGLKLKENSQGKTI